LDFEVDTMPATKGEYDEKKHKLFGALLSIAYFLFLSVVFL
jgi:hypothetical protein